MAIDPGDELVTIPDLKREKKRPVKHRPYRPPPPGARWLTIRDVCARFRISRTSVWTWVSDGLLPKPAHLGQRALWRTEEIDAAEARLVQPAV